MQRRRRRPNYILIVVLLILIAAMLYVNQVVIPEMPSPFVPTPTATRDPESFIAEAEALFNEGKLFQSIEKYQEAIRARSDDASTYIAMARVQVFAGQYEDALVSTENALLLNPNNSMVYAVNGWAQTFLEDYIKAEAAIRKALELDPNNALAHAYYAELLINLGTYDDLLLAIDESNVALSLAPNALETHRIRGLVLEVTDNREEAIREYEAAIAINANIPDLHLWLGRTYRVLGVLDKATDEYSLANSLNPSDPTPDLYTSRAYAGVGEFAKAVQFAESAVRDDPIDPYLRGNLGVMYYRNFEWSDAIDQLSYAANGGITDDGLVIDPLPLTNDAYVIEYYFTYALVLARSFRCPEVLPVAQRILSTVPNDETAVYNAQESLRLCEESLLTPSPTPAVTLQATATP